MASFRLLANVSTARTPEGSLHTHSPLAYGLWEKSLPGAKANTAKHSPVEATAVTMERLLSKYWDRMVTAGRKLKQYPRPERERERERVTKGSKHPGQPGKPHAKGLDCCLLNPKFWEPRSSFWKNVAEQTRMGFAGSLRELLQLFWGCQEYQNSSIFNLPHIKKNLCHEYSFYVRVPLKVFGK